MKAATVAARAEAKRAKWSAVDARFLAANPAVAARVKVWAEARKAANGAAVEPCACGCGLPTGYCATTGAAS